MRVRRISGLGLMPVGVVLILASFCDTWLAIAGYFDIVELWDATCPDRFHSKALLIAGAVIAVIGQRLYSGRNLKTGEKAKTDE